MVHAGKIVREFLRSNSITITVFADKIGRSNSATYKILSEQSSMTIQMLLDISHKLGHNFFYDIGTEVNRLDSDTEVA